MSIKETKEAIENNLVYFGIRQALKIVENWKGFLLLKIHETKLLKNSKQPILSLMF